MMKRFVYTIILMSIPLLGMAQDTISKKQTKYEEFVSRKGVIIKYVDKSIKSFDSDGFNKLRSKIRTFYGQDRNTYFWVINDSYIEYNDLKEINLAYDRLLKEVDSDCALKPEYLKNTYANIEHFSLGYYVRKSKATWTVTYSKASSSHIIIKPAEFANYLKYAQEEIEALMHNYGK